MGGLVLPPGERDTTPGSQDSCQDAGRMASGLEPDSQERGEAGLRGTKRRRLPLPSKPSLVGLRSMVLTDPTWESCPRTPPPLLSLRNSFLPSAAGLNVGNYGAYFSRR